MALGFILFGWPKRTKEFGPSFYYECPACEKEAFHHYTRARRWFTLYFIPLLPLWRASFYATCNNCGFTEEIENKTEAKRYKRAAKLTDNYLANTLPDKKYYSEMNDLLEESEMIVYEEPQPMESPPEPGIE